MYVHIKRTKKIINKHAPLFQQKTNHALKYAQRSFEIYINTHKIFKIILLKYVQ